MFFTESQNDKYYNASQRVGCETNLIYDQNAKTCLSWAVPNGHSFNGGDTTLGWRAKFNEVTVYMSFLEPYF